MNRPFKCISVIGLGYIGLPTAAMFAFQDVKVIGVDLRHEVIDMLNAGKTHFSEPDLDGLVHHAVTTGRLKGVAVPQPADAFIIAVPTPINGDKSPDTSMVEAAARSIAGVLKSGDLVVIESTSPIGTTEQVSQLLASLRTDLTFPHDHGDASDIRICYCPERILPGRIVSELVENDRVIGGVSQACTQRAAELYGHFCKGHLMFSNARTAELVKLVENAYRDVNVAFANELSMISAKLGIDVWDTIELANRHPRVNILKPGPGVGGHCIAVDPWFIVSGAPDDSQLIRTARMVNDSKPLWVVAKVRAMSAAGGSKRIACLGLTYKADVDDVRESPAIEILKHLAELDGIELVVADPNLKGLPRALENSGRIRFDQDMLRAIEAAEIVVLLVDHREFKRIEATVLADKQVIDTRNCWPGLRQTTPMRPV